MSPLEQLLTLVRSGHWLPVILLATMIVRKWVSSDSKFPITIPKTWQPSVTAFGGLVYAFCSSLQQGQPLWTALLGMAATAGAGGFLDGILVAIFDHDNAPVWARSIVFVFDDLTGGTSKEAAGERVAKSVHPPPLPVTTVTPIASSPPASIMPKPRSPSDFRGYLKQLSAFCALLACLVAATVACSKPIVVPPSAPGDVGGAVACVIADVIAGRLPLDCVAQYGQALVNDAVRILQDSHEFTSQHPAAVPLLVSYKGQ